MRPNYHALVHYIVDRGVNEGWADAHDELEDPSEEQVIEAQIQAIMDAFNEFFEFEDLET